MSDSLNFIKPYLRGWLIIIGAMVLAYLAASKYLNYATPMYESTAKLRLADMNEGVPNSNLFKDLDVFATTQKINAEIELLKSHALIARALQKVPFTVRVFRTGNVRNTELFDDSPVHILPLEWKKQDEDKNFSLSISDDQRLTIADEKGTIYSGIPGDTLSLGGSTLVIMLNEQLAILKSNLQIAGEYQFSVLSPEKQISLISSNLDVVSVDKDVPVIRISYKSAHPVKAAIFPNALAEAYIEDYIENKYVAANVTADFLNDRIAEISNKLEQSEAYIQSYRDRKNITNIKQETETDLRKISQLKIQQTNLKMSLEAIRDLEAYIRSGKENFLDLAPNFEAFTDLLSTEIIKKIKQLQAEKKDLLLQYTEKDERVMVIDAKLKDLTSYLTESITNTRKNLETKYSKLVNDIEDAEQVFIDVPEKERMMTILNREFEIFQQSYNFLNQKKIEAEIAKSAKVAFHRVITPAAVSKEPVSPNRSIIKIVSVILGMISAIVLIFIVHSLKGRVNDAATVESSSMIPIVALVPKLRDQKLKENFFVKMLADWEVKGLFREQQIICLTGFDPTHGVDFIGSQMAKVLTMQQRRLLLIRLHSEQDAQEQALWKEGEQTGSKLTIHVAETKLKELPAKEWQEALKTKSTGFDCTIVLNAAIGNTHTLAGMAAADLNIVCLDTRLTPAKSITEIDLMQQAFHLPNVNFIINRAGYTPSLVAELLSFSFKFFRGLLSKSTK